MFCTLGRYAQKRQTPPADTNRSAYAIRVCFVDLFAPAAPLLERGGAEGNLRHYEFNFHLLSNGLVFDIFSGRTWNLSAELVGSQPLVGYCSESGRRAPPPTKRPTKRRPTRWNRPPVANRLLQSSARCTRGGRRCGRFLGSW
jgi:hypothetical protein